MSKKIKLAYIAMDFSVEELDHRSWGETDETLIAAYWSGESAPPGRHFRARLLWSDAALYVRFEANQSEPLVVSETPNLKSKTPGLWDRDVCEIFIAPDSTNPRRYFEFEIAPSGEWIDLGVHQMPERRETDWNYCSGMQSAARIEKDRVLMAVRIPWEAFGRAPQAGEAWPGNLFRCVGSGEGRGYLAWSPTRTPQPNFHVPEAFGRFEFAKQNRKI